MILKCFEGNEQIYKWVKSCCLMKNLFSTDFIEKFSMKMFVLAVQSCLLKYLWGFLKSFVGFFFRISLSLLFFTEILGCSIKINKFSHFKDNAEFLQFSSGFERHEICRRRETRCLPIIFCGKLTGQSRITTRANSKHSKSSTLLLCCLFDEIYFP